MSEHKELGRRSKAELEELFGDMYTGWDSGVVVTQERFGNGDTRFAERPMTDMELAARYVAAEIGANIFEIASRAAFAPIITFSQIQAYIGPVFDDLAAENSRLRSELEQARGAVDVLERNASVQAKLLADTGRELEQAKGQVERAKTEAYEDAAKICEMIEINAERRGAGHVSQSPAQNTAYDKAEATSNCKRAIRERMASLAVSSTERP